MSLADVERDAAIAHDGTIAVQQAEEGESAVKAQQDAWCESHSDKISAAVRAEELSGDHKVWREEMMQHMVDNPKVWSDYWANRKRSLTFPNDLSADDELLLIIARCEPINKQPRSVPVTSSP